MKRGRKNITLFQLCPVRILHSPAILFILVILYHPGVLLAEDRSDTSNRSPGLTASLNKESVPVGGIVELTLAFHLPEGAKIASPPDIKGLEGLTVVKREAGEGIIRLQLLVDRLGSWKTGEISLAYTDVEGRSRSLKADPVSLTVLSNLGEKPEDAQLRPIQDIIPVRSFWSRYWHWLGLGLLLVVITGLFLFYRSRRRAIGSLTAELIDPPHIRAKKAIAELEKERLFEKGDVKAFYFRFSEIVRQYLEGLRGFPAVELTTEEITSRIGQEQDRKMLPLLRSADLAKFADSIPSAARKEEELKTALSYIEETGTIFEQNSGQYALGGDTR